MSLQLVGAFPTFSRPRKTATAGTVITSLIQPVNKAKVKVTTLKYSDTGTAHTLTFLRPLAKTKVTTAVAAAGTSYILARDPGNYSTNFAADALKGPNTDGVQAAGFTGGLTPIVSNNLIAANDYLAIQTANPNVFFVAKASGATTNSDGTVTITADAAPTGGVPANAEVYFFGITTDTHPITGEAHQAYASGAGTAVTTFDGNGGEIATTYGLDEPLLFYSNNASNAGVLEILTGVYGKG